MTSSSVTSSFFSFSFISGLFNGTNVDKNIDRLFVDTHEKERQMAAKMSAASGGKLPSASRERGRFHPHANAEVFFSLSRGIPFPLFREAPVSIDHATMSLIASYSS